MWFQLDGISIKNAAPSMVPCSTRTPGAAAAGDASSKPTASTSTDRNATQRTRIKHEPPTRAPNERPLDFPAPSTAAQSISLARGRKLDLHDCVTLPILHLDGTPYDQGRQHGLALRERIAENL